MSNKALNTPEFVSEACKHDSDKPQLGLISHAALTEEAAVMGYGATKYERDNWRKGMAWSRAIDAALRHIHAFNDGEDFDPETEHHHLAHARCNLAFLIEYASTHPDLDDRHKTRALKRRKEDGC